MRYERDTLERIVRARSRVSGS
ncbi:hypothetical protein [Thiorhodovibrio frisius]